MVDNFILQIQGHIRQEQLQKVLKEIQANGIMYIKELNTNLVHATTTRYKVNDVVKYGGGLWICTYEHTPGATNLATDETGTGHILNS